MREMKEGEGHRIRERSGEGKKKKRTSLVTESLLVR
jgi:hypothetical protein